MLAALCCAASHAMTQSCTLTIDDDCFNSMCITVETTLQEQKGYINPVKDISVAPVDETRRPASYPG